MGLIQAVKKGSLELFHRFLGEVVFYIQETIIRGVEMSARPRLHTNFSEGRDRRSCRAGEEGRIMKKESEGTREERRRR